MEAHETNKQNALLGKMGGKLGLALPTPPEQPVQVLAGPRSAFEHKKLLHSGYHLVQHHEDTLPHLPHGTGTLVAILVVVHVVAISYLVYLFSKPIPATKRKKRGKDLKAIHCEDDFLSGAGNPSRSRNVIV